MSLFSRIFSGPAAPWAAPLGTAKRQAAFVECVERVFRDRGVDLEFHDGAIRSRGAGIDGGEIGIGALVQACSALPKDAWAVRVTQHFEGFFAAKALREALPADDFEAIRPLLRIHFYPASIQASLIAQRVADDMLAAVVIDLPTAAINVAPDQVAAWGRSPGDVFDIALDNVRKGEAPSIAPVGRSGALTLLTGDYYTASRALLLDEIVGRPMPHGALVACPSRHAVLFHVVEDSRALGVLAELLVATEAAHAGGPESLSCSIYWQRSGDWVRFPISDSDGARQLVTPVEYGRVLMELGVLGPEAQEQARQ